MKINIVVGGRFHVEILAKHLIEQGHDIKIYSSTPTFFFKNRVVRKVTVFIPMIFQFIRKITKIPLPSYLKFIDLTIFDFLVSKLMRNCDLIYGFAGNSYYCGLEAKKKGILYFLDRACPHTDVQQKILEYEARKNNLAFKKLNERLRKRLINEYLLADKIIVPSTYTLKTFINNGFKLNKIFLAPLEAKITTYPNFKKRINETFTIGVIGGDLLRKGYIYLFKAYNELNLNKSKLIILGNKKEILKSKRISDIYEKRKDIIFIKHINNINKFYSMCDIFCLPSVDDGFGMVIPEAMANGLPIITTKNVGSSFLVKNRKNGFVVLPRNAGALKKKIAFFYKNRQKINAYGKNSFNLYNLYKSSKNNYSQQLKNLFRLTIDKS